MFKYRFKVKGDGGIWFDVVLEGHFSSAAWAQIRAQYPGREIVLQETRRA